MTLRFAVLSDIHGNLRALDAVLDDLARRGISQAVHLGDCAYGPFDPRPAIARLRGLSIPGVSGNEDRLLVDAARFGAQSPIAAFDTERLHRFDVDWLASLPMTRKIHGAFLFHGTPRDDSIYLLSRVTPGGLQVRAPDGISSLLAGYAAILVLCGHDHTARTVQLDAGCLIVNPGSVGCPAYRDTVPLPHAVAAGTPHARYAIVDASTSAPGVELIRVAYDWRAAAGEAQRNGFPDWAQWIATGQAS